MLCFSAHCTACSVLNDMTTTFTADSLQKHGKFDIKPHLFGRNTVASCLKGEVTKVTSKIADIISEPAASADADCDADF